MDCPQGLGFLSWQKNCIMVASFSLEIEQIAPLFDESLVPFLGDIESFVTTLALEKLHSVKDQYPSECILAADSLVWFENQAIGKATTYEEIVSVLKKLSAGQTRS